MGGSGKTVVASGIARDPEVGTRFRTICFLGVGQDADIRELQRSLHFQLQGSLLDSSLQEAEVFATLRAAAATRNVLLIVDDAWALDQVSQLNCIDPHTASRTVVTTRIGGLVPGAGAEFSLGVLSPEDAVALMKSITPERCQQELQEHGSTDFGFAYGDQARFRVAVFRQRGNVSIVLRLIPNELLTFEQIGLPEIVRDLIRRPRGLFVVTGPTGSGKTTSLATMW